MKVRKDYWNGKAIKTVKNVYKIYWNTAQIQRTSALFPKATKAFREEKGLIEYILKKAFFFFFSPIQGWKVKQDCNLACKKTKSLWLFHIDIWTWCEESNSVRKALEGQSWKINVCSFLVQLIPMCYCKKVNQKNNKNH